MVITFYLISMSLPLSFTQDLEAADMEMVQQCSLAQTDGNLQKWELIISEHLERMEDVRRHRQAEAYRNNQRLKHKLLRKTKDDKEAESSSVCTPYHFETIIPVNLYMILLCGFSFIHKR